MKIVTLTAENVKRLKAIEINPDGFVQVIGGRNAQGKSSVLDTICFALFGAATSKENAKPIRDGEDTAFVRLDLGDIVVTRTWKGDTSTLKVEVANGAKYPAPQEMLNKLLGKLAFDPLEFTRLDAGKQREALIAIADLPIDLEDVKNRRNAIFDERTEIGRTVKSLEGQLDGLGEVEVAPAETVSVAELVTRYDEAREQWNYKESLERQIALSEEDIARCEAIIKDQTRVIKESKERRSVLTIENFDALKIDIDSAEETNNKVRRNAERKTIKDKLSEAEAFRFLKTEALDELDKRRDEALSSAKFPIDGLSFDDDGVLFNGIPFTQVSDSEKIRVSLSMGMALNPDIRVIILRDGSLLDGDNMALISQMAHEKDYQIFIERVGNADEMAIIIEDGMVQE